MTPPATRSTPRLRNVVIVGASLAGHHVAATLRRLGYQGTVTVVGEEVEAPYDRYPLSKAFLVGTATRAQLSLDDTVPDVEWHLGRRATGLDLTRRRVTVDEVGELPFDGLVIASGARPRDREAVAGIDGAFVLRTLGDAVALRKTLQGQRLRVVVVGGGLIGAEIVSEAARGGHHTTWAHSGSLPTSTSLGTLVAKHLVELHRAAEVRIEGRQRVESLGVAGGRVTHVNLHDGRRVDADVVVMATGTLPNVEWLGAVVPTANGVLCGPTMHVRGTDRVVAVGDVARAPHAALAGQAVRVEHWASARHQAELAARNLVSPPTARRGWTELPTFGTTIQGTRIRCVGFPGLADRSDLSWGSLDSGSAGVCLSRRGQVVAAIGVNAEDSVDRLHRLVRGRPTVDHLGNSLRPAAPPGAPLHGQDVCT
ncbi:FAD/NAD(P)-binding oxidoreductase [Phycicoccus sp. M110.8]|uniref:NAD(P)/FAD-dependent oxidoreductase n=1 Tax=Phycicoccus sp. M110.8 TaxID=3075433 RepID=UPI0028FD2BEB|nr:FAD/NAD(P)-binding oxidoreductase [Phycicoccus sp. M110.8]MDU0313111.1 FAD/NAD(P)-binding oxidoreductase [Phycicoccus sp. M110.8]